MMREKYNEKGRTDETDEWEKEKRKMKIKMKGHVNQ